VGIGREVMMIVKRGMTRNDKRMKLLLLLLDILTRLVAAELLLAGVNRSLQAQAWYKLTF
jgi:hypothetical protein